MLVQFKNKGKESTSPRPGHPTERTLRAVKRSVEQNPQTTVVHYLHALGYCGRAARREPLRRCCTLASWIKDNFLSKFKSKTCLCYSRTPRHHFDFAMPRGRPRAPTFVVEQQRTAADLLALNINHPKLVGTTSKASVFWPNIT